MKTANPRMKIVISSLAVSLFAAMPNRAFASPMDELPRNHWSVLAVQQLTKWGVSEGFSTNQNLTRYDLAVATARVVDKFGYEPKFASDKNLDAAAVRDILASLLYEYRDELMRLETTDHWEIEAYYRAKKKYRFFNASDWSRYAKNRPWKKDIVIPASSTPRLRVTPAPKITIPFPNLIFREK